MMSTAPDHPPKTRTTTSAWLWTERVMWGIGITAFASWTLAAGAGVIGARLELQRFAEVQAAGLAVGSSPDQRLWSPERQRAWRETAAGDPPPPMAVLRIPRIELEVAVLEGTSEWTLNRAVGHIEDTALPGTEGNAGIAGHRDGFFRGLKDIRVGDVLEVETLKNVDTYRIERTWIVDPDDVSVLDPTASASITLVTCYPFYFVGSAPQRFIVRAVRTQSTPRLDRKE
jgi:sortase A